MPGDKKDKSRREKYRGGRDSTQKLSFPGSNRERKKKGTDSRREEVLLM